MKFIVVVIILLVISIIGLKIIDEHYYYLDTLELLLMFVSVILTAILIMFIVVNICYGICRNYYLTSDKYYDLLKARDNDYAITEIIDWNEQCYILGVDRIIEIEGGQTDE